MSTQYVNDIPLGNGEVVREFFLIPGESLPIAEEGTAIPKNIDPLIERYFAEQFLEFDDRRLPVIYEGTFRLSNLSMETLDEPFQPATRFRKAITARQRVALEKLLASGGHDGENVSVRDWHVSGETVTFIGQSIRYSQFRATDAAQDEPLCSHDDSFPESATLRDYVVVNGKESRKGTDVLSNLLGATFFPRVKGRDGQDYFLLGRRRSGDLSVIGGTPMWEEAYFDSRRRTGTFAGYMRQLGIQEHEEELGLHADEIEIGSDVLLIRSLLRAFDPFFRVDVDPSITVEDIARRCFGNAEALKEHDRLYAVPRNEQALKGLLNNTRGYTVHQGILAGLYLILQNESR